MTGPHTLAADYDVYEVAFLAGGPRRAVDTAVVALTESGRLRVTPLSGELSIAEDRHRHPLEAAVLDAVGRRRGQCSIDTLRWRLESDERLSSLGQRLERDGLVSPAGSRSPLRLRHWQLFSLTGEGRRTLRHLRSDPPPDRVAGETGAMAVALAGTGQMADRDVRATLFEPPPRRARPRFDSRPRYDGVYSPTPVGWFGGDGGGFCGDGGGGGGDGGGC